MRLIRMTLFVHGGLHLALWVLVFTQTMAGAGMGDWPSSVYQALSGALIIHLGSYHWAMAQWHEELCEGVTWPAAILTPVIVLALGVTVLLSPQWALYAATGAAVLLFWQESYGRIQQYIQPWYLRLRWLQLGSLLLTQLIVA